MTETAAMRLQSHVVWRSVREHVPEHLQLLAGFAFATHDKPDQFAGLFGHERLVSAVQAARTCGQEV